MPCFKDYLKENFSINVNNTSPDNARSYSEQEFSKKGKSLDEEIPEFDKQYKALQKKLGLALNIPRIDMPVIEPKDMKKFLGELKNGELDIFKPFAFGSEYFPKDLLGKSIDSKEFLHLGMEDHNKTDDVVKAKLTKIAGDKLKPTQSEIWLENVIGNIIKFGIPKSGSPVTETVIIVSKDGYILDGHHRFAQVMLANPKLKMSALYVPLDIDTLLKIGRSYGNAVGNSQKA